MAVHLGGKKSAIENIHPESILWEMQNHPSVFGRLINTRECAEFNCQRHVYPTRPTQITTHKLDDMERDNGGVPFEVQCRLER